MSNTYEVTRTQNYSIITQLMTYSFKFFTYSALIIFPITTANHGLCLNIYLLYHMYLFLPLETKHANTKTNFLPLKHITKGDILTPDLPNCILTESIGHVKHLSCICNVNYTSHFSKPKNKTTEIKFKHFFSLSTLV